MVQNYSVNVNSDNDSAVNFLNMNMKNARDCLNICHINARSIPAHIDELSFLMTSTNIHIVGISETWLRDGIPDCTFKIPGYVLLRNDRNDSKTGGGVGIYIRDHFKAKIINKTSHARFEALFIEVILCSGKLVIGVLYNPRVCSIDQANEFIDFISNSVDDYHRIVVMGDFNLNMANPSAAAVHFYDSMTALSIEILPFTNTRFSSALDLMMITCLDSGHVICLGQTAIPGISDHDLIFMSYRYRHSLPSAKFDYVPDFSKLNEGLFLSSSLSERWDNIYFCNDIDSKVECFNSIFTKLFNDHIPVKRKLLTNNSVPWFNGIISEAMNERNTALLTWRRSRNLRDWVIFKQLRNKTNRLIRDAKRKYYFRKLNSSWASGNIWKVMRSLGMMSSKESVVSFSAEEFVNQFSNLPLKSVVLPLPQSNTNFDSEFNVTAFTEIEVASALNQVKSNATGHDNIIPKLMKILLPVILPYCTHIFNHVITTCSFPVSWKMAVVIPVSKVSTPSLISDFRPISILPYLSKVFEILLCQQMKQYLNENNLLDPFQSGFRTNHSTTTALGRVYFDLLQCMNQSQFSVLVLLDFSKAFDCIDHVLLVQKLWLYFRFSKFSIRLIVSYLSNRLQFVKHGGVMSSSRLLLSGVPQGSVLGPLLFSLYINDLSSRVKFSRYHVYADDFQLYNSGSLNTIDTIYSNMNSDLEAISRWAESNGLILNAKKSQVLPIYKRKTSIQFPAITINGENLVVSDVVRNLGVLFNSTLTWQPHVNNICKKVNFVLYSLRKLSNITPMPLKKLLVKSLILPIFTYSDIFIYNSDYQSKYRLRLTFNSCIRYVYSLRKYDHVSALQETILGVPLLTFLRIRMLCFIFKLIHIRHPSYLYSLLSFSSSPRVFRITSLSSRSSCNQFASSIFVDGIIHFNSLPEPIKRSNTLMKFKTACTDFYKINYI